MAVNGKHTNMCLISLGNWNNTTNAGVGYVNWNNNRTNTNNNVGGRFDYSSFLKPRKEDSGATGICFPALGEIGDQLLFSRKSRKSGVDI